MVKPTEKEMSDFYKELGKIFFLVANADNHIHEEEIIVLKKIINEVWLDDSNTSSKNESDKGHQIELMFDTLVKEPKSRNLIFTELRDYVSKNKKLFTTRSKILIIGTAQAIADAFAGTNSEEKRIIDKLKVILK